MNTSNLLKTHPLTEQLLDLDDEHCIVDKKDVDKIRNFFEDNPELIQWIGKGKIKRNIDTGELIDTKSICEKISNIENNTY